MSDKERNRFTGLNLPSVGVPSVFQKGSTRSLNILQGLYLAKVVDIADENYQGGIHVEIVGEEYLTNKESHETRRTYRKVRQTSPFGGAIQGQNFTNSYGATFHPPAPGTEVLVAFTGRDQEGFLVGILNDAGRNSSLPGLPASELSTEGGDFVVGPAMDSSAIEQQGDNSRPRHPIANAIATQGLGYDPVRGIGSSGARRESPSNVSGFLTPGGHSITMDDGTLAYQEGIVYTPDRNRQEGQNNLIRIRSAQGGQFLINDSAGIVYIINQSGTSWVQMDSNGNVDIYAQGNVSMRSEGNFNVHADGDFNVEAENINMKARGGDGIKLQAATSTIDLKSNREIRFTADTNMHLKALGTMRLTTDGVLDLNGPPADPAQEPTPNSLAVNRGVKESVSGRVPEHEPWGGHVANESSVAAQARSTVNTATQDYNLTNNTGGGGANSAVRAVPISEGQGTRPPIATDNPRQSNRYDARNPPRTPTQTSAETNPRSGGPW